MAATAVTAVALSAAATVAAELVGGAWEGRRARREGRGRGGLEARGVDLGQFGPRLFLVACFFTSLSLYLFFAFSMVLMAHLIERQGVLLVIKVCLGPGWPHT